MDLGFKLKYNKFNELRSISSGLLTIQRRIHWECQRFSTQIGTLNSVCLLTFNTVHQTTSDDYLMSKYVKSNFHGTHTGKKVNCLSSGVLLCHCFVLEKLRNIKVKYVSDFKEKYVSDFKVKYLSAALSAACCVPVGIFSCWHLPLYVWHSSAVV